jgi:hypothetical protein
MSKDKTDMLRIWWFMPPGDVRYEFFNTIEEAQTRVEELLEQPLERYYLHGEHVQSVGIAEHKNGRWIDWVGA